MPSLYKNLQLQYKGLIRKKDVKAFNDLKINILEEEAKLINQLPDLDEHDSKGLSNFFKSKKKGEPIVSKKEQKK